MTAEEIRHYVLTVHAPLADAEAAANGDAMPWYWGSCDSTCVTLEYELRDALAPFRVHLWGSFSTLGGGSDGHCWLEGPRGEIVDPTSQQYGLDACLISRPGDPHHHRYVRGETPVPAWA